MGTREQIETALGDTLEPGESVRAWRALLESARVEPRVFDPTFTLRGPAVFTRATQGAVTTHGVIPERTNFVVVTDRRLLWCSKGKLSSEISVGGVDPVGLLHDVEVVPARIALASIRFAFLDGSAVQFDLPSDHRADEFAADATGVRPRVPVAA